MPEQDEVVTVNNPKAWGKLSSVGQRDMEDECIPVPAISFAHD